MRGKDGRGEPEVLARQGRVESLFVQVADEGMSVALRSMLTKSGFDVVVAASVSSFLLTDDRVRDRAVPCACAIEIVAPLPRVVKGALDRVRARVSQAVVLSDRLDMIGDALRSCGRGEVSYSDRALELEQALPAMTGRQDVVLGCVARGERNREIAEMLVISDSAVRREIRAIEALLGVSGRTKVAVAAVSLGYSTRRS